MRCSQAESEMPKVVLKTTVAASPDRLWRTVRGFGALASWHPLVERVSAEGESVGSKRSLAFSGLAGTFIERLDQRDDEQRVVCYAVTDSPLPIEDCAVELRVMDNGDGSSTVSWVGTFSAASGDEMAAVKAFHRIFHGGISRLEDMYGVVEGEGRER